MNYSCSTFEQEFPLKSDNRHSGPVRNYFSPMTPKIMTYSIGQLQQCMSF